MKKLLILALALMMSLSFACAEEETPAFYAHGLQCAGRLLLSDGQYLAAGGIRGRVPQRRPVPH